MRPAGFSGRWAIVLIAALWSMSALAGCGRKLPPSPPAHDTPPAVTDLAYRLEGDYVTLTWTVPAPGARGMRPIVGFRVERAVLPAADADCANCPLDFRPIGELRAPGRISDGRLRFSETITPGLRYIYRVTAFDERRLDANPSKPVSLTF
jgi:predicted small lipoprotein YifL